MNQQGHRKLKDAENFIVDLLRKVPRLNSVDAKIFLQDMYETFYGIYNHLDRNNKNPLATVMLHPSEDISAGSYLEDSIRLYISRGIKDLYGLNFIEFLNLPRDIIRLLLDISSEEASRKSAAISQIESQMGK
jgi:hypothetical protein